MVGLVGRASSFIDGNGKVMVHGEYWDAHAQTPIPLGTRIRVVKMDGLKLEVETEDEEQ
jgi:membrane-bound serine protease (ClpP class)